MGESWLRSDGFGVWFEGTHHSGTSGDDEQLDLGFKKLLQYGLSKVIQRKLWEVLGSPCPRSVSVPGVRLHLSLHKAIWLYMDRLLSVRSLQTFSSILIHNISFPSKMSFQDFSDIQEKYFYLTEKLWKFFSVKYNLEHIVNVHISRSTSFRREIPIFFFLKCTNFNPKYPLLEFANTLKSSNTA